MKNVRFSLFIFIISFGGWITPSNAMEIIFGRKYPIAQTTKKDQLAWLSVEFEKDPTGKVLYRLEASHPKGKKLSYLKGRDYLLSEEIQSSMVRNFEIKVSDVDFDSDQKVIYEVVLPYDFQTRYLPLKFEKDDGYQEIVIRLRFGDYRFMLASRVLNSVSNVESSPVIAAKGVEQLYKNRALLKKRPPKLVEKQEYAEVNVDDIYNNIREDLNIQSRIVTDFSKQEAEVAEPVMDEFDSILSKYSASEEDAKAVVDVSKPLVVNKNALNSSGASLDVGGNEISFEDKQRLAESRNSVPKDEQDIIDNPTTDKDYAEYLDDLNADKVEADFNPDASIDEIIANAGANWSYADDEETTSSPSEQNLASEQEAEKAVEVKPKTLKPVYVPPPVDEEELFGFASDNWVEPRSAPVLVMKPNPVDQKRRISSVEKPKRNNFVEWTPPNATKAPVDPMGDLFGGGNNSEANPSGLGF